MEVIKLEHPHRLNRKQLPPLVLALGFFDGIHLGHQKVIGTAVEKAKEKGIKSAVMTFDPHPSVVLRSDVQHVQYITPLKEKMNQMAELDVDYLFIVKFTPDFANLTPQEFVDQYVIELNAVHVVAGFDYTYGRMGKGTMDTLLFHSRGQFDYSVIPKFEIGSDKVSSTRIRKLIQEGKFENLPPILGRFYTTRGRVVHGDKRGRTIGFPTANTEFDEDYFLPPIGVYSVRTFVLNKWYNGVCNIGYKPTFNKDMKKPSIEVHIFQFDKDIYGEEVVIEWHQRLRSEKKFQGIDELIAQISKDKEAAINYFRALSL